MRVDLTENNIYTLSEGTRNIIAKLDTPVEIRFYATRDESVMPVRFRNYARRVEDILDELEQIAGDNLEVIKYDPQPDSDAADMASLDGVEGQPIDAFGMSRIYLGISISMLDTKVAIPFLAPDREKELEYDLARAISRVITPKKPVVGIMSTLPMFGAPTNPMMQQPPSEPWIIVGELQRDFDVREISPGAEEIESDIDVLMVVHPKTLAETTEYAIDQYLLGGGKVVALLDPVALTDNSNPGNNPMQRAMQAGSNLERLLPAWGLSFDASQVVADRNFMATVSGGGGRPQQQPAVLSLTDQAINRDDIVTGQIDSLTMFFAGAFTGEVVEGIEKQALVSSSENAQLVQGFMAQMGGEQILKDFKSEDKEFALALRLTGDFKSAFPDGKPDDAEAPADGEEGEEDVAADEADTHLAESSKPGLVVLIGDTDFVFDRFAARVQNFMGQRIVMPQGGNLTFAQSVIEHASGDSDLIAVRSRATMERPFTVVREMQSAATGKVSGQARES